MFEREKNTRLQEKLSQEKSWMAKEEESIEKKGSEIRELKDSLLKTQQDFDNEYALRLRLEKQLKDAKSDFDALQNEKREFMIQSKQFEGEVECLKKELAQQKKINAEIKKENDEAQWVAKSEFDRIEKLLKEKEKELERISRDR